MSTGKGELDAQAVKSEKIYDSFTDQPRVFTREARHGKTSPAARSVSAAAGILLLVSLLGFGATLLLRCFKEDFGFHLTTIYEEGMGGPMINKNLRWINRSIRWVSVIVPLCALYIAARLTVANPRDKHSVSLKRLPKTPPLTVDMASILSLDRNRRSSVMILVASSILIPFLFSSLIVRTLWAQEVVTMLFPRTLSSTYAEERRSGWNTPIIGVDNRCHGRFEAHDWCTMPPAEAEQNQSHANHSLSLFMDTEVVIASRDTRVLADYDGGLVGDKFWYLKVKIHPNATTPPICVAIYRPDVDHPNVRSISRHSNTGAAPSGMGTPTAKNDVSRTNKRARTPATPIANAFRTLNCEQLYEEHFDTVKEVVSRMIMIRFEHHRVRIAIKPLILALVCLGSMVCASLHLYMRQGRIDTPSFGSAGGEPRNEKSGTSNATVEEKVSTDPIRNADKASIDRGGQAPFSPRTAAILYAITLSIPVLQLAIVSYFATGSFMFPKTLTRRELLPSDPDAPSSRGPGLEIDDTIPAPTADPVLTTLMANSLHITTMIGLALMHYISQRLIAASSQARQAGPPPRLASTADETSPRQARPFPCNLLILDWFTQPRSELDHLYASTTDRSTKVKLWLFCAAGALFNIGDVCATAFFAEFLLGLNEWTVQPNAWDIYDYRQVYSRRFTGWEVNAQGAIAFAMVYYFTFCLRTGVSLGGLLGKVKGWWR